MEVVPPFNAAPQATQLLGRPVPLESPSAVSMVSKDDSMRDVGLASGQQPACAITNQCPLPDPEVPAEPRPGRRALAPDRTIGGVGDDIRLPLWELPQTTRSFAMHFSLVSQIDGLSFKCQGPGARIERDVLVTSAAEAVCHIHGHAPWMSTGSFCGLFLCDFQFMPAVVATVASHKGYGIFIVPTMPNMKPALAMLQTSGGAGQWRRYGWYNYLLSKSLLVFDLPPGAFTTLSGTPVRHPHGVQAVLAQFGQNGHFKHKKRPEWHFKLHLIPSLLGPKLAVRPSLFHMVSPLAWAKGPLPSDDVTPASAKFIVADGVTAPSPLPSRWSSVLPEFKALAKDFPCQGVAKLAIEGMTTGLNTYKGSLDKAVMHPEPKVRDNVAELAKRATMMKEVILEMPRIIGPLPSCPFESARVCPTDTREKDPYDPESERLRLISDFSRRTKGYDNGSVNDLCWSPDLLSYHATAEHIRDTLAWLFLCFGPGVLAWTADIPSCFRLNHLNAILLSLFVYKIVTGEYGTEWFVDLATPFGWCPAEWGWQCMLALILWAFHKAGLGEMFAYVDNFFFLLHPAAGGPEVAVIFSSIEATFRRLNIPLHEKMSGDTFKGLGWMWDTSPTDGAPFMVCAEDKFSHLCRKLPLWAAAKTLPFPEMESIIGFLSWVSAGFPIGKPHLAYLRVCLLHHKDGDGRALTKSGVPERRQMVSLDRRAREALLFWRKFFPGWNKRCRVFLDFGPMAGPEVLWRVDASTEWGMGAFMWVMGESEGFYILHAWTEDERKVAFVKERESSGVFEGMAAARCVKAFSKSCSGLRVLMEMDNDSLALGIRRCYSKTDSMMDLIRYVCETTAKADVHLRAAHVKGQPHSICVCASCLLVCVHVLP